MADLKKCPFCGADAVMDTFTTSFEDKPRFRVRCTKCACDLGWEHWSVEEAAAEWNRRGKMTDREQVIKAIQICYTLGHNCTECPFFSEDDCNDKLMQDALALLKAQEPRVLTADELKEYLMINDSGLLSYDQWRELNQRAPLYMEFREPEEFQVNWWTVERLRPWAMESMFWEKYKIDRRCWASRPTEEQRRATPWND